MIGKPMTPHRRSHIRVGGAGIVLAVLVFGALLNFVPNGHARPYSSAHCAKGEVGVPTGGVPCTATIQEYGWPIKTNARFTHRVSAAGYIPPDARTKYYVTILVGWNTYLLGFLAGIGVLISWTVNNNREYYRMRKP
jgi:hypothetical protein